MGIMNIFNRRIQRHIFDSYCTLIVGDRGTGKSSLMALIADEYIQQGYDVYCQYPYDGVYQIPMKERNVQGVKKYDIDKEWLYSADLQKSIVMIDECRTVWPARSYAKWTQADDEFFNLLRHYETRLFLATQVYDAVDLNVKRASDETYYLSKGWFHMTHIESSYTTLAKVADRNTEVIGRRFKQGMRKVVYDICEMPAGNFRFWRKPYYGKYDSLFTFDEKIPYEPVSWNNLYDFKKKEMLNTVQLASCPTT